MEAGNSAALSCVNCGINLRRQWKTLAIRQNVETVSVISENISPNILTENDYICKPCSQLTIQAVDVCKTQPANDLLEIKYNEGIQKHNSSSHLKNNQMCLVCGIALKDRQSRGLFRDNPTQIDNFMYKVIHKALPSNTKIAADDKLCTKCWAIAKRSSLLLQAENNEHETISIDNSSESSTDEGISANCLDEPLISLVKTDPEDEPDIEIITEIARDDANASSNETENDKEKQSSDSEAFYDDPNDLDFTVKENSLNKSDSHSDHRSEQIIRLPNYKRSPNYAGKCIFTNCKNKNRRLRTDELCAQLLKDQHFYMTKSVRICDLHRSSNSWHQLYGQKNSLSNFTVEHIEHAFSLVSLRKNSINYNNVLSLDDNLFEFLTGITKNTYKDILMRIPELKKMEMGLSALLIKQNNQNTVKKVAHLLKVSRTTMRVSMNEVKKIITGHPVIKELGIKHIFEDKYEK